MVMLHTERFTDRRDLPPGEWDDEPDKAVWIDENTDLDCMIVRNPMGALCGYVGVGPEHPLHGRSYGDLDIDVRVHGGLTYADECDENGHICHVPQPGRTHDVWWFGFDCAHSGDLVPSMSRYPELQMRGEQYRNFGWVKAEVESLAEQLHGISRIE